MLVRHLYLHVPFCLRRCSYCDFAVHPTRRPAIDAWLESIDRELLLSARIRSDRDGSGPDASIQLSLSTIYVGGGTPSLLGTGAMKRLRSIIEQHGSLEGDAEWTAEANPESFTSELADDWMAAGVNRLSVGVQSFQPPALRWMGRLHGPEGAVAAMRTARDAGFNNINIDLIFGLPEHLGRDWRDDLDRGLALGPDHVSLYGLSAEPAAALGRWVREGRAAMPPEECYSDEYLTAARVLAGAGYRHYEVSNFARPGKESRHNRAYWLGVPYLGLGPGAHSYLPPERWWNVRDWRLYHQRLLAGADPVDGREQLDPSAVDLEHIWLGLRTLEGALLPELTVRQRGLLQQWQQQGWAELQEDRLRLTPAGWLLLDQLTVELDSARA
jgi:oxygen-independent coproporphyrinogen-3 oxidase